MSLNREMSDRHEEDLAGLLGGRIMPGSGNQFNNQMDVRVDGLRLAIDGKSTRTKTISITKEMIEKAKRQAQGYVPAIALRWYEDDRLKNSEDWIALPLDALVELLDDV